MGLTTSEINIYYPDLGVQQHTAFDHGVSSYQSAAQALGVLPSLVRKSSALYCYIVCTQHRHYRSRSRLD